MDLYNDALELDAAARKAFLDAHCNGDAALRAEVETLLASAATPISLPTPPPWPAMLQPMTAGQDLTGMKLGQYEIRARLGAGGMGEVWKAWDDRLKREVAIKLLSAELAAESSYLARFQQEARTASALHHANIITIYEVSEATTPRGVLPFIVTEYIEGQTLRDYLTQPAIHRSWRDAVRLATQIASALATAHAANLIHRDIKPENIMVTATGQVKVLDFGIAKLGAGDRGVGRREEEEREREKEISSPPLPISSSPLLPLSPSPNPTLTAPGTRLGTIRYMSPEQARGEALDARTDIFSLGLVLYELLTGQRPYGQAEGEEMLRQLTSDEEIKPVSTSLPQLPAALDRIVTRALRKQREERYPSASEMLSDLQQLRINREEKGLQRLRAQSANQMLTQFVVRYDEDKTTRIPLGGLWTIGRFADLPRGKLERELLRKSRWSVLRRLGGLALVIAAVTLGFAAWASVTETWEEKVLRDGHTAAVRRAAFSPDGTKLVSVGEDKQVIVWDFEKRERLATFNDHTDWVTTVEFSPDGKWFVTAGADGNIIVWDALRLTKVAVLPCHRGVVRAVAFSGDGRMLVTPTNDDHKNIWEVGSWRLLRETKTPHFRHGQFLLSHDGRWFMMPFGNVYDLLQERIVADSRPYSWGGATLHSSNTRPPFWSWAARAPDGRHILSIDAGGYVAFTETEQFEAPERRKLVGHFRAHTDSGRAVAFSSNGKLAATGAEDIVLWDALVQKKLARLKHSSNIASLAFSPQGNYLVSAHTDGSLLAWDPVEREMVADFNGHHADVEAVAFTPDGRRVASAGGDGSIIVWDAAHRVKEATLLWHSLRVNALAFSTNGQSLISSDLDGNLAMWEVEGWRLRWTKRGAKRVPAENSYAAALSPNGRWAANSYGVYETGDGNVVYDFRAEIPDNNGIPQPTEVRSLAFSADGRWLFSVTARGDITVRRTDNWQVSESQKLNGKHLVSVCLSPDGKGFATGEDEGAIRLWQIQPLRQTAVMEQTGQINTVAFSPDGKQVVSAGDDKTIALWDVAARQLVTRIGLHTSPVYAVAWSPDGRQIVSGEHDHSVRLYTRHQSLWGWRWE